jgi:hypothetical protein
MIIPYKYMNKAVVTFSIAVLALAGCESDSDSFFDRGGGALSSRVLEQTDSASGAAHLVDTDFTTASRADDSFRVTDAVIDTLGRVRVTITGTLRNNGSDGTGGVTLGSSNIDDDSVTTDIANSVSNADRVATLVFELNNDLDLSATSVIPSIAPGNAPMWTAFNGDPRNLYYRNRARRLTRDGSILFKEDVSTEVGATDNYVEYHALAYLDDTPDDTDANTEEIVRVEVVFLNYDDAQDDDDGSGEANENVLENGGEDNIALGLEFNPGTRTVTNDDGESPVTGRVSYRGRYMGRNRLTFTGDGAYDVDGDDGDIGAIASDTDIVLRESNIPVMTMNVNFGADDNQVRFRIRDARLSIDEGVSAVDNVEGSMNLNIEGTAELTLPASGGVISLSSAAITGLNAGNLRLTFTSGTGENAETDTDTIRLGSQSVGGDSPDFTVDARSSISGYFFNRGAGAALQARAVAGSIYWSASGTDAVEHPVPVGTGNIDFDVVHEMAGVFLLER